jgi:hypothetical protein
MNACSKPGGIGVRRAAAALVLTRAAVPAFANDEHEREGAADNFRSVLLSFNPANLRLQLGVGPACDNGMP